MKYLVAVFVGACSYGVLSTVVKLAFQDGVGTAEITIAQFLVGWMIIGFLFMFSKKNLPLISRKQKCTLMLGGVPSGLVGVFYYMSLETVEASFAIILLFQFVWIGILIDSIVSKKMPGRFTLATIIILLLGTALSSDFSFGANAASINFRGVIFGILAAVSFACFIFANAKVAPDLRAIQRSFYMVTGSLLAVLVSFLPKLISGGTGNLADIAFYGLLLGFFGVFIPPFLFAYGMPKVGSALGSILGSAELPVTILLSMLLLKEEVSLLQWTGVILILLAIVISNLKSTKKGSNEGQSPVTLT